MSAALRLDALVDNRAGQLPCAQRKNLGAMSRGWRKVEVQFAGGEELTVELGGQGVTLHR